MKKILIQLNEWFAKSKAKHGYNIKAGTKQFCIIRKAGPMSEKEPKWFTEYRLGQNDINNKLLEGLSELSTKVNSNTKLIKQAHPELFEKK